MPYIVLKREINSEGYYYSTRSFESYEQALKAADCGGNCVFFGSDNTFAKFQTKHKDARSFNKYFSSDTLILPDGKLRHLPAWSVP